LSQTKSYKSELVGVFGHPVAENPTIVMMEAAFREAGLDYRYLTIEVLPGDLGTAVAGIRAMGFRGINLTIPHKIEVMKLLDGISENATSSARSTPSTGEATSSWARTPTARASWPPSGGMPVSRSPARVSSYSAREGPPARSPSSWPSRGPAASSS